MNKNNLYNNQGFTLIEVLIAVALLSIVLFGFSNLFLQGRVSILVSGNINEALLAARGDVESWIMTRPLSGENIEDYNDENNENLDLEEITIFINNSNGEPPITISGLSLTGEATYNSRNQGQKEIIINYFKPLYTTDTDE